MLKCLDDAGVCVVSQQCLRLNRLEQRKALRTISLGVFVVMWRLCTDLHWCHWSRSWRMSSTRSIPRRSSSSRTSVTSRRRASCQQASGSYFEVPTREALWFGGYIGSAVVVPFDERVHRVSPNVLCVWRSSTTHVYTLDALSLSLSLSLSLICLTAQGKAISVVRACGHNRQRNIRLVDQLNEYHRR